ncbi:hypothetical protein [Sandaracinus amylolyticus]|uniref:Uncharacterized protein n=1 Tax=Sandaracinus amylolyticus TaxID=927083 RepID=A0A0F6SEF8_9BACT|nr:hypothetical protein [Sandaracinus amylolyticus]AKF05119.1 hypothetical protein DB32_002268 [Sandaracinus amylolyticus]
MEPRVTMMVLLHAGGVCRGVATVAPAEDTEAAARRLLIDRDGWEAVFVDGHGVELERWTTTERGVERTWQSPLGPPRAPRARWLLEGDERIGA